MKTFETVKGKAEELGLPFRVTEHEHVHTSAEAAKVRGYSEEEGTRRGAKAMIIRSEGKFYQFVLPGDRKLDFKKVKKVLHTESASLASPDEVEKAIGVKIGAVPPCGSLFGIPTYVDQTLLEIEEIDFNPGSHTHTMTMRTKDWMKLVEPTAEDFVQKP